MINYKIVIPARYGSSRLPGKPLLDIAGKPMVWHVYQRALETNIGEENIFIATDDERILHACTDLGMRAVMTQKEHESGTDRLAEVASFFNWHDDTIVVNLQGDEPLIPASIVSFTAQTLATAPDAGMATLGCPITSFDDVQNPNCVKLVRSNTGKALYFSRAPIPFARDGFVMPEKDSPWLRHIGMYAYTVQTLRTLSTLPVSQLENIEKLEQLRALQYGIDIQVAKIDSAPAHGVDTEADLQRVRELSKL